MARLTAETKVKERVLGSDEAMAHWKEMMLGVRLVLEEGFGWASWKALAKAKCLELEKER